MFRCVPFFVDPVSEDANGFQKSEGKSHARANARPPKTHLAAKNKWISLLKLVLTTVQKFAAIFVGQPTALTGQGWDDSKIDTQVPMA